MNDIYLGFLLLVATVGGLLTVLVVVQYATERVGFNRHVDEALANTRERGDDE